MHGTSFLVFALYIFTVTVLLTTLNCHGAFLSSWSSPFIFSFWLSVYSILNCHGASFSVVLALYIVLFFISTGLLLYSQLSWHILFLSLHPLYCLFSLASLLSTVMAHLFASDFSPCTFILFHCHCPYLAFYYSQLMHNFVSSIIYAFRPSPILIFLQILISPNRYSCFSL